MRRLVMRQKKLKKKERRGEEIERKRGEGRKLKGREERRGGEKIERKRGEEIGRAHV